MWRRLLARIVVPAALIGSALVATTSAPAQAVGDPPGWYDGGIQYSTVIDCGSIIWNNAYTTKGVGTWVGAIADLDESPPQPGINQTFYIRVIVGGIGNACSGTGFRPGFTLPIGVSRDTATPVLCYINGTQTTNAADCPQTTGSFASNYFGANSFAYISGRTQDGNLWPAAPGATWEFRFPVKSTTVQNMAKLQGHVEVADGNANPTLKPSVSLNVFPSTAAPTPSTGAYRIVHDKPSTFASTSYNTYSGLGTIVPASGMISEGKIFTQYQPGMVHLRRATSSARLDSAGTSEQISVPVDNSQPGWKLFTDWDPLDGFSALTAGQTYYWRLGFTPTGGSVVWGDKQSFVALSQRQCNGQPVTVSLALGQLPTDDSDVILGTSGKDTINGLGGNDSICSLGGDDFVDGGDGNDWIDAGSGNDVIVPRGGNDVSIGGSGTDTISYYGHGSGVTFALGFGLDLGSQNTGGAGFDAEDGVENLTGTAFSDILRGSNTNNRLVAAEGNDTLEGNGGDDVLMPGTGTNSIDGMGTRPGATPGRDTLSYADQPSSRPVTVDLRTLSPQNVMGTGFDTIVGILHLIGGKGADRLKGTNASGTIRGGPGSDQLWGFGGKDSLFGESGNDKAWGGAGNDKVDGSSGQDSLFGESGKDVLIGGSGKDRCEGGSGKDTAKSCEKKVSVP